MLVYGAAFAAEPRMYRVYINGAEDHGFAYECGTKKEADAWIAEQKVPDNYYKAELEIEIQPKKFALHNAKELINKCVKHCKAGDYKVYLSPDEGNFREQLAFSLPYKGNRWSPERREAEREKGNWLEYLNATEDTYTYQPKPVWYEEVRTYLLDQHGAIMTRKQEADDALGIRQIKGFDDKKIIQKNASTVICTLDKDMRTIPGYHYNWWHEEFDWVSESDARYNFYTQILTGDTSDNIKGLPAVAGEVREAYGIRASKTNGCGPAAAKKILEGCKTDKQFCERIYSVFKSYVEEYYIGEGLDEKDIHNKAVSLANEAGSLVYIRHEPLEIWKLPI